MSTDNYKTPLQVSWWKSAQGVTRVLRRAADPAWVGGVKRVGMLPRTRGGGGDEEFTGEKRRICRQEIQHEQRARGQKLGCMC